MTYEGFINKCRTYDLTALSQVVDSSAGIFILYSPEQLGIAVPVYMAVRLLLNGAAIVLRNKTTGKVGEK